MRYCEPKSKLFFLRRACFICQEETMLLRALLQLLDAWRPAFQQDRSARRAAAQALGMLAKQSDINKCA